MKPKTSAVIMSAMAVVIVVLLWALVYFARDELRLRAQAPQSELPVQSSVGRHQGFAAVRIALDAQSASGIATQELKATTAQASAELYGTIISVQPLIELRARYVSAVSEARALRAAVANSEAEYQRTKKLFEDDRNVAQRSVQAAQAQLKTDQARLAAAEQSAAAAHDSLRAAWGAVLADWATNPESAAFDALAQQRELLVLLSFPYDRQTQAGKLAVSIAPLSADAQPRPARYISPAAQSDPSLPGATFLYAVNAVGLRVGMRVAGRLSLGGKARAGVIVPASAVVWHGGKAWAYVKRDDDLFLRKELDTSQEMSGGWFNVAGFEAGEHVVVSGAQLLLSEELKFQIRNENED